MENDATIEAARTALVAMNWDGFDPRPVAGLIFAITDELEAAGHSRRDVTLMLRKMSELLPEL
ncbi:hypothetical protein SAMN05421853_11099 [Roseivivax halotolerans]|uniref:Uncharacterized protein n=1 Tax=Roseivivax halotolerans TaxID=93684 RepID=A0A1I5ZJB5_9RHOB|nr:hypothetical protein [Roseivivax halotolerans]SFQ56569.1 hypothetical protein SAMN05421853_11099 [Roseivivax halotolerans]